MKRALSVLLCLTLLASLCLCSAGCGAPAEDVTPEESAAPETAAPTPTVTPPPTATPQPSPPPSPLETGSYTCKQFITSIPDGWQVDYEVFDAGGGISRIVIRVSDPEDPNNMIFYTSALEPFFTSLEVKNAYLPHLDSCYEWSPVLSELSAEGTLRQWAPAFTLMQAEGRGLDGYFKNYLIEDVLETVTAKGSDEGCTRSGVLARVSIPGADRDYAMYFENSLTLQPAPAGMPEDAVYYISYDNCGVVVREDQYEVWFPQLLEFMRSLNLYAFAGQHDILGSGGVRLSVKAPSGVPLE